MSLKKQALLCSVAAILISFQSCVNLKNVSDYSTKSLKGIQKFEEVGYTFHQACLDRCLFEQIRKTEIVQTECPCAPNKAADSVTLLLYNTVKGYYDGLAKLSNNGTTEYKFDAMKKALTEGKFGDLEIKKEHVNAYSKISSIILRAATDAYRRKKLTTYVEEANQPIQVLLSAIELNVTANLKGMLDTKKQRLNSFYFDLTKDNSLSKYEKIKVIDEYNNMVLAISNKQRQIDAFGKTLRSISAGHQKLYDNRNKMTAKEVKEMLAGYASDIQNIIDEFNKLKNQEA